MVSKPPKEEFTTFEEFMHKALMVWARNSGREPPHRAIVIGMWPVPGSETGQRVEAMTFRLGPEDIVSLAEYIASGPAPRCMGRLEDVKSHLN